jgi:aspartyl-tRNA(Asn)/glutamyl-tRNA(Gln) amidotransferase subunit B
MYTERPQDLIHHLRNTLPPLSDDCIGTLVNNQSYSLTSKDASTLLSLDDGERLDYYYDVVEQLQTIFHNQPDILQRAGKATGNWYVYIRGLTCAYPYTDGI